jgi:hypothetical protein
LVLSPFVGLKTIFNICTLWINLVYFKNSKSYGFYGHADGAQIFGGMLSMQRIFYSDSECIKKFYFSKIVFCMAEHARSFLPHAQPA